MNDSVRCRYDLLIENLNYIAMQLPDTNVEYLLAEPENKTNAVAIFLPGMSGHALDERYENLASGLNLKNISLMRLECWASKDDLNLKSFESIRLVLSSAVALLKQKGYEQFYGIGKSFGGSALFYAKVPEFRKLVLWAPILNPTEDDATIDSLFSKPFGEINSLDQITVSRLVFKNYTTEVFVLLGSKDSVVNKENLKEGVMLLPHGTLVTIPNMDHTPQDSDEWNNLFKLTTNFIKE